jgi:glycosyltransferase involved in cell wall biosynthesis
MKIILFVHNYFPQYRSGTEVLTLSMATNLAERGHDVYVVTGEPMRGMRDVTLPKIVCDTYQGMTVYRLMFDSSSWKNSIQAHSSNISHEALVAKLIMDLNPNIAHFNHVYGLSAGLIPLVKSMGIPVIFTATDFWSICPTTRLFRNWDRSVCDGPDENAISCLRCYRDIPNFAVIMSLWLSRHIFKGNNRPWNEIRSLYNRKLNMITCINTADIILTPSAFTGKMLKRNGIQEDKIRKIPFGVDVHFNKYNSYDRQDISECKYSFKIGFIGSLDPLKGADVLIRAFLLLSNIADQACLKIYGALDEKSPYGKMLINLAKQRSNNIFFCGTFPNEAIGTVLKDIDILVIPSIWYENTPLVLYSALAAKVPVLVSNQGGLTEIVKEGRDGYYFTANDAESLSKQLQRFIDDKALADRISQMMPDNIRTVSDYIDDVELIYQNLLRNKSAISL